MWVFSFSPISAPRARATCSIKSPSQSQLLPSPFIFLLSTKAHERDYSLSCDLDPLDLSDDVGRSEVNAFGHVVGFDVQLALQVIIKACLNDSEVLNNLQSMILRCKPDPSMLEAPVHIDFCWRLSGRQQVLRLLRLQLCPLGPTLRPSSSCCHVSPLARSALWKSVACLLCGVPHIVQGKGSLPIGRIFLIARNI